MRLFISHTLQCPACHAGHQGGYHSRRYQAEHQHDIVRRAFLHCCTTGEGGNIARKLAVVNVEKSAGNHPNRGDEIIDELDIGQAKCIVEQVKGKYWREAQQEDE